MSRYLLIGEASEIIRTPVSTLHQWSSQGEGPPVRKVGRRLLYREDELFAWVEGRRKGGSTDPVEDAQVTA